MQDHEQRFGGIGRLYGQKAWQKIKSMHVAVIGLGGVGSWTAEAFIRTGIQNITLIDLDEVCISNTNRQLHALDGNIGKSKVEAMKERMLLINPHAQIECIVDFFTPTTAEAILSRPFDVIVDAIDSVDNKCLLLAECRRLGRPIVTCGSVGGRTDPTLIRRSDLNETTNDGLLKNVRKKLRKNHDFPGTGLLNIPAVFSMEVPVFPNASGEVCPTREKGVNSRMDCTTGFGTASFVSGALGFAAASAALDLHLNGTKDEHELDRRALPSE